MNDDIKTYLALHAAHTEARDRSFERRGEISRELKVDLVEAQNHPDFKELDREAQRFYREADALTHHVIRANLERMNIQDMPVTAVLCFSANKVEPDVIHFRDGAEVGRVEMLLSDICCMRYSGLAKRLDVDPKLVSSHITIVRDGLVIGKVTSDGYFCYEAAPNTREALGWKVATDGGRVALIEGFNLDEATKLLLDTIRTHGIENEAFFGPYFKALKQIFVYKRTTRFGDGYCGAATVLWHVATRELGYEHPGYAFHY